MKRVFSILMILTLLFSLAACSNNGANEESSSPTQQSSNQSSIPIAPFCTSGGSGLSGTVNEIKELEPNAVVTDGLHIGSSSSADPDNAVSDWLEQNNIK